MCSWAEWKSQKRLLRNISTFCFLLVWFNLQTWSKRAGRQLPRANLTVQWVANLAASADLSSVTDKQPLQRNGLGQECILKTQTLTFVGFSQLSIVFDRPDLSIECEKYENWVGTEIRCKSSLSSLLFHQLLNSTSSVCNFPNPCLIIQQFDWKISFHIRKVKTPAHAPKVKLWVNGDRGKPLSHRLSRPGQLL